MLTDFFSPDLIWAIQLVTFAFAFPAALITIEALAIHLPRWIKRRIKR